MITDEQVKLAQCAYNSRDVAHSFEAAMRKAIEAYEQSKLDKTRQTEDNDTKP